ncbi:D-alanyl-D-alanine carboxypeptidase family protein [Oceanobacillus halophilus]|uniref:D-alanyl-D-alanine carboxypeptidase n=1 Tax=Oceanobacillus halophilus TaxID=930130 RepID=A0A495AD22_9BACI|nr:D-alanyl-D-alanine carboxypeptidase family protein [Oceanobacillus halophilus]RKQ37703.1 D-alanyl-D-alanine carboxypeptidase [Oceanobacillus halophilus]
MKIKYVMLIVLLLIVQLIYPTKGQAAPGVSANNAVLIEKSTGRVLFEKNAHNQQSIASITKIMTAIIAIESGKMDEKATVSRNAIYTEGSSIYLEQGEKMTIRDLVYGLMLRSGNDAAVAIAEHVGGSVEGFAFLMNEKANWLGMNNTHFDNPHGLDSDSHYSSAYDMAMLMRYAMENAEFREITAAKSYKSEDRTYSWQNKNKLLTQFYEYCIGGKTGYTKATGRTLVSAASKDGMELIAVTLDAPSDWKDHMGMFDWAFDNYDMESIVEEGPVKFNLINLDESAAGYVRETLNYPLTDEEKKNLTWKNYILNNLNDLEKPDSTIIGKTVFYLENEKILETPIHKDNPEPERPNFISNLVSFYQKVTGM